MFLIGSLKQKKIFLLCLYMFAHLAIPQFILASEKNTSKDFSEEVCKLCEGSTSSIDWDKFSINESLNEDDLIKEINQCLKTIKSGKLDKFVHLFLQKKQKIKIITEDDTLRGRNLGGIDFILQEIFYEIPTFFKKRPLNLSSKGPLTKVLLSTKSLLLLSN